MKWVWVGLGVVGGVIALMAIVGLLGALVTVTERGFVRNPIFRFLARFVFGYSSTLDAYLKALGKKFGEDVSPG